MSIKNQINEAIKWTSSKFNEYRKAEVVEQILKMKPYTFKEFECGAYSEKSWCGGYRYTVHRTKTLINIYDTISGDCLACINVEKQ
jgi:hypothetical protein